jgi:hypothetical protein
MFISPATTEDAWQAMRRPGPLRDGVERQLILTEFVAGEEIDQVAFGDRTNSSRMNAIVFLATE